jgi:hypothetical protein
MPIRDNHHRPIVLNLRRPVRLPIETQGRCLPLQSIRGFRDLVLLDPLMMMGVLHLAQHRIEMRDAPRQ